MPLPVYKLIHVNSHIKDAIETQLTKIKFEQTPLILNLTNLGNFQSEAIEHIENYLDKKGIKIIPYAIYIIGRVPEYSGRLTVIENKEYLPKHFYQRTKNLNNKENALLKKIELKNEHFKSIQNKDFYPTLINYAENHKKIYQLSEENSYLEEILNSVKN